MLIARNDRVTNYVKFLTNFVSRISRLPAIGVLMLGFNVIWLLPDPVAGSIVVFDRITTIGQPVFLKVQTRGRLFSEGGRRVTLTLGDKQAFELLTGGDGYGYVKYTPAEAGRFDISAAGDGDVQQAVLLVAEPDDTVIVLEAELLLKSALQASDQQQSPGQTLQRLAVDNHLVYVSRYLGVGAARRWLSSRNYPEGVTLDGKVPLVCDRLKKAGLEIRAVIGGAGSLRGEFGEKTRRLTFDDTDIGTTVKSWREIETILTGSEASKEASDKE